MSLLRATFTVSGLTLVSRVLGFVRDILMASVLGAGWIADCFVLAFKLPNLFRRLFAEGAFNAAFVPLFSGYLEGAGSAGETDEAARRAAARRFAEEALSALFAILLLFVAACQAVMPWLMMGIGMGFVGEPEKFDLAVELTRITFPYLLFISLVSLMGGVLNSLGRFAAVAATPVLLNLSLIGAMVLFANATRTPAHALSWGVSVAGVIQFLWLFVACWREGMPLRLRWPRLTPDVRKLITLMLPVALGAGAYQISLLIDVFLASFLADGSLAFLYYADRLNQLPLGVIGIAVGTALLPALSRQVAAADRNGALASQNRAIEMALFLTLPAAAALVVVPGPVIGVLFERNAFDSAMTAATAAALGAYALGLPAYVLAKVLGPGFFARKDTATPVRYSLIALGVNVVLNVILMIPLAHVGLALATAISAWVNAALLYHGLVKRDCLKSDDRLKRRLVRTLAAVALMVGVIWGGRALLEPYFSATTPEKVLALVVLVAAGLLSYGVAAFALGAVRRDDFTGLRRRNNKTVGPA
ncbi:MAG: murein biosynthesis integral membrane protein MurJ [Alphaproteobacteria bacterium]|nr:MAG: murein biosynthesis integral membrane protein MurJ [Alphaproteobacteria bacterium]